MSAAAESVGARDDETLREWIAGIGSSDAKIVIIREEPTTYKGVKCDGQVGTHTEPLEEDEIAELYGGHKYLVKLMGTNPKTNKYGYLSSRRVRIAGEPKLDPAKYPTLSRDRDPQPVQAAPSDNPDVTIRAMEIANENAQQARRDADRVRDEARNAGKMDADTLAALTEPYKQTNAMLKDQLDQVRGEMSQLRTSIQNAQVPKETTRDVVDVFGKLINDGDSRLASIKEGHASELRSIRDRHESELSRIREQADRDRQRLEDRHKDDAAQRDRTHESEMRRLEKSHESEKEMLRTSFASKEEVLKGRISDLERQLTKLEAEVGHLRAIKEKSPIESLREAAELKETIADLTGSNDEEKEGSVFGQIAEVVGPLINAAAHRVQNAQPQAPRQPMPQRMRRRPQMHVPAHPAPQQQQPGVPQQPGVAPVQQAQQQVPQQAQEVIRLDPSVVQKTILFMETAVRNNADPTTFAMSAQAMVPGNIIQALRAYGIERFLVEVAQVPESSPLLTATGRKFVRKVTQVLIGGAPAAPAAPPPAAAQPAPAPSANLEALAQAPEEALEEIPGP